MTDKTQKTVRNFCAAVVLALAAPVAPAADYDIDPAHSFIQFRVKHLGFSWLVGRFNRFSGSFHYDADNPAASKIELEVETASVDSNHAERDKHLRNEDFLDVTKHPQAVFKSTRYEGDADGGKMHGTLTLHGRTNPMVISISKIGEGDDPWGGYRAGFEGWVTFARADYGMNFDLGPSAKNVEMDLYVEGIRR